MTVREDDVCMYVCMKTYKHMYACMYVCMRECMDWLRGITRAMLPGFCALSITKEQAAADMNVNATAPAAVATCMRASRPRAPCFELSFQLSTVGWIVLR